ncbi:unnamed protein product [Somion occarium]|uniref:Uncharacterized protein n=1 Tax=Somion occarium TaxID=3059160 RepID=A0ABP1D4B9_9APHY
MDEEYRANATRVCSIFYDFFLAEDALSLLSSQCRKLLQLSGDVATWNSGPYAHVVRLCSFYTLQELRRYWQAYLDTNTTGSFKNRYLDGMKHTQELNKNAVVGGRSAGPLFVAAMQVLPKAFHDFWETGIMSTDRNVIAAATHVNPMFAHWHRGDGFVAHHATFPPSGFPLAPLFAPVQSSSFHQEPSSADVFRYVKNEFHRWCSAFHDVTRPSPAKRGKVIIRLLAGDALAASYTLRRYDSDQSTSAGHRVATWTAEPMVLDGGGYASNGPFAPPSTFNVIETSNLADHLGIMNILIAATPLLAPSPTSALYTETLHEYGSDSDSSITAFAHSLCCDIATMSVLLDLTPVPFVSTFNSHSNLHEIISCLATPGQGQFHERTHWKIPSLMDTSSDVHPITSDPKQLARLLFDIYLKMFWSEDLSDRMRNMSMEKPRAREAAHYSRLTFALFIQSVQKRVTIDWHNVIKHLLDLMNSDKTLLIGSNSLQDFSCHLHSLDMYSVTNFAPVDPAEVARSTKQVVKRLHIFDIVPPVICIVLSIPRAKLQVLEDPDLGNPGVHAIVRGGHFLNYFTPIYAAFGDVIVGESQDVVYIEEDPHGRLGSSSLVISFWIPSWTLASTKEAITVAFGVQSTPQTAKLSSLLGMFNEVFSTSLDDMHHVWLVREPPRKSTYRGASATPIFVCPSAPEADPISISFSTDNRGISSFTIRTDVVDTEAKTHLAERSTEINATQISPCRMSLSLGTTMKKELSFPFPVDGPQVKLRIARKSAYIEVVAPLAGFRTTGGMSVNRFPMIKNETQTASWNLHLVNLDNLPALDLNDPTKIGWMNFHVSSMMMSTRELPIHNRSAQKDPLLDDLSDIKDTLHIILASASGTLESKYVVFALNSEEKGGIDSFLFVAGLRLDLPAHTVVADAFVLPVNQSILKTGLKEAFSLTNSIFGVNLSPDELIMWKRALPAMAERCRHWTHKMKCLYKKHGKIPLSTEYVHSPLCDCGVGRDIQTLITRKEWKPFAPYVTRVAISPLFSVSYLESVCGNGEEFRRSV